MVHEIEADHPAYVTELSDANRNVRAVPVDVIIPGDVDPVKLPISGALVFIPS